MNEEKDEYIADALTLDQIVDQEIAEKFGAPSDKTVTPKFSIPCDAEKLKTEEKEKAKAANRKRFVFGNIENNSEGIQEVTEKPVALNETIASCIGNSNGKTIFSPMNKFDKENSASAEVENQN